MVFHGGGREEGVVARGPGAPERLLPRVELHVVVQRPLLCETSVTQVAGELPAWRREREGERRPHGPQGPASPPKRGGRPAGRGAPPAGSVTSV